MEACPINRDRSLNISFRLETMYFTYLILSWIFWTFQVKTQIYAKTVNYYEPISGPSAPSILKPFKASSGPSKMYQDSPQNYSWAKRPRNHHSPKKGPQKQKYVFYYPPPKTYHYPYVDRFRNFYKNPGFHNYNNINNYYPNNQYVNNKSPKQTYEAIVQPQKMVPQRETGETKVKFNRQKQNGKVHIKNGTPSYPPVPYYYMGPPGFTSSDYRLYTPRGNLDKSKKNEPYKNHNFYKNHKMNEEDSVKSFNNRPAYIRDHAPENESEESSEVEESSSEEEKFPKKHSSASQISPDGNRVEFQIQGHEGPRTYVFGYDTGEGSNRQYRLEEKLKDGTVKGQYGYYDARGKLRAIKYVAKPSGGYEEKHHESYVPDSSESS